MSIEYVSGHLENLLLFLKRKDKISIKFGTALNLLYLRRK